PAYVKNLSLFNDLFMKKIQSYLFVTGKLSTTYPGIVVIIIINMILYQACGTREDLQVIGKDVICFYTNTPPVIDGRIGTQEWNRANPILFKGALANRPVKSQN